ncbi:MAG: tetratricopeptide repeat protein [Planctomycetales bacterium]|nr:tetratricopeptide repeat protein [Planctomycetales bacterium]
MLSRFRRRRLLAEGMALRCWLGMLMLCWTATAANGQEAKSSPEALRHYSNAVKAHNNKAYSLAADEWSSFLEKYPRDPLATKAHYYLGVCHLQSSELDKAVAEFSGLVKDPKFELIDDARFNLGWSQYSLGQLGKAEFYPQAVSSFAELVKANPKSDKAPEALYLQGECLYLTEKREEAAAVYARIVSEFPQSARVCDALYAQGVAWEEAKKYPEAGQAYDQFLGKCAMSELVTEVKLRKAETVLQAGQFDAAAQLFAATAATEGFELADHATYRQAFCLAKLDKFAEAAKAYASVTEKYPKSQYVARAEMFAARSFYKAGELDTSAVWLDKVLARGGEDVAEAAHWRCRVHLSKQEAAAAEKLAAATLPKAGESEFLPNLKLDEADAIYEDRDRRAAAVEKYEAIAAAHADTPVGAQAMYYAAFGSLELQQHDKSLSQARAFLAKHGQDSLAPDAQYIEAESLLHLKQYPESEQAFTKLLDSQQQHADRELWLVRRSLAMYLQKKYEETVAATKPILAEVKGKANLAETRFLIGGSEFYLKQYEPAAASLSSSLEADAAWPRADETMLLLSRCKHALGQHDEAAAAVTKLLADYPNTTLKDHAYYRLAEYQYAAGKLAEAVKTYDLCLQANPESEFIPYALYGKGWTLLKEKKYAESETALTQLLDKHAGHDLAADARFARAMARRQSNRADAALEDLAEYLKAELPVDQLCHALYEKGLAEVALKKHEDAVKTFRSVLEKKADYADGDSVLYEIGWAHKALGDEEQAIAAFAELTKQHGDSSMAAESHYHVAESLYTAQKYPEAEKEYAAARDKSDAKSDLREKSLFKLGWSLFQQQKYAEAAPQFAAQLQAAPAGDLAGDGEFMQAESLFRGEKHAEAMPLFVSAADKKLSTPTMKVLAQLHAGQCATQLKKWDEGLKLLNSIPTDFHDSPYLAEALYERGWARQNTGDKEQSLADYRQAAEKGQGIVVARSRFMAGELLFEKRDFEEAIKEFQRVMFFFGDNADDEIKNWQAKSGYEAGRCADVQILDEQDVAKKAKYIADAKKFYEYVVQKHPMHMLAKESSKRLAELAKL